MLNALEMALSADQTDATVKTSKWNWMSFPPSGELINDDYTGTAQSHIEL